MGAIISTTAMLRRVSTDDNAIIACAIHKISAKYGLTADRGYTVTDPNLDELF